VHVYIATIIVIALQLGTLFFLTGIKGLLTTFPDLKLLTSEVYSHCVNHFGKIYFGTD